MRTPADLQLDWRGPRPPDQTDFFKPVCNVECLTALWQTVDNVTISVDFSRFQFQPTTGCLTHSLNPNPFMTPKYEVVSKYSVSLLPMDAGRLNKYGHYGVTVYTAAVYVTRTLVRSTVLVASVCRTAYLGRTQY